MILLCVPTSIFSFINVFLISLAILIFTFFYFYYFILKEFCVEKSEKKNAYVQFQPDRIVNIRFTHAQLEQLLEKKWFEKILNLIETDETYQKIKFATPSVYRKKDKTSIPYFVSHGIHGNHGIYSLCSLYF